MAAWEYLSIHIPVWSITEIGLLSMAEENLHAQCSSNLYSTGAHMVSESQPSVSGISFVSPVPDGEATLS